MFKQTLQTVFGMVEELVMGVQIVTYSLFTRGQRSTDINVSLLGEYIERDIKEIFWRNNIHVRLDENGGPVLWQDGKTSLYQVIDIYRMYRHDYLTYGALKRRRNPLTHKTDIELLWTVVRYVCLQQAKSS